MKKEYRKRRTESKESGRKEEKGSRGNDSWMR